MHVIFVDVVGYSTRLINKQSAVKATLNQLVKETSHFRSAEAAGKLIRIPTGDGMALVFFNTPEAPVQCALEIFEALRALTRTPSGPDYGQLKFDPAWAALRGDARFAKIVDGLQPNSARR